MVSALMDGPDEQHRLRNEAENALLAEREGELAAMTRLADEQRASAHALAVEQIHAEALAAARRRSELETAVTEEARMRLKAESAARARALERAAAEREAERLADQRIEAEELALAEARRHELAATELRAATAARLQKETKIATMAEQRLAAEQAAFCEAIGKTQAEHSLEAIALSRAAIERDTSKIAKQREDREHSAEQAAAARAEAERSLAAAAAPVPADGPARQVEAVAEPDSVGPPRERSSRMRRNQVLIAVAALGAWAGWAAGTGGWLRPLGIGTVQTLRLDGDVQAIGRRLAAVPPRRGVEPVPARQSGK
jgi:hypothetical protein